MSWSQTELLRRRMRNTARDTMPMAKEEGDVAEAAEDSSFERIGYQKWPSSSGHGPHWCKARQIWNQWSPVGSHFWFCPCFCSFLDPPKSQGPSITNSFLFFLAAPIRGGGGSFCLSRHACSRK